MESSKQASDVRTREVVRRPVSMLLVGIAATAALISSFAVTPAMASESKAESVKSALFALTSSAATTDQAVLSDLAIPETRPASDTAVLADSQNSSVVIPRDPESPIILGDEGGSYLNVTVPKAQTSDHAAEVVPGVVSFNANDGSQTAAVAKSDGSLQLVTVLEGRHAPSEFAYTLDSRESLDLKILPDGSVVGFSGDGRQVLAIAPAWATDANGTAVGTHYEIRGEHLIQIVDHEAADIAYPVVADPTITWFWWGYATKFTKSETRQIANSGSNPAALAVLCGLIASAPGAVACGAAGYFVGNFAVSWVQGVAARGHCLQINATWFVVSVPYEVNC